MNHAHPDKSILERLNDLEGAHRSAQRLAHRWRAIATGLLGLLTLGLLGAAAADRTTLEANEFVLRDDQGRLRAALAMRPDGTPGLGLFDENGQIRLSCELGARGMPGVHLLDEIGTLRAAVAVRPDETPGLGLFGPDGRVRASVDVGPDGTSGMNVFDGAGALRAAIAIRPDGTPGVAVFDELGQLAPAVVEQGSPHMREPAIR